MRTSMLLSARWRLGCFHPIMDDNGWMGLSHRVRLRGDAGWWLPGQENSTKHITPPPGALPPENRQLWSLFIIKIKYFRHLLQSCMKKQVEILWPRTGSWAWVLEAWNCYTWRGLRSQFHTMTRGRRWEWTWVVVKEEERTLNVSQHQGIDSSVARRTGFRKGQPTARGTEMKDACLCGCIPPSWEGCGASERSQQDQNLVSVSPKATPTFVLLFTCCLKSGNRLLSGS